MRALLLGLVLAAPALGNIAARPFPPSVGAPRGVAMVEVLSERLIFSCVKEPWEVAATYRLRAASPQTVQASFLTFEVSDVRLTLDGAELPAQHLPPDEADRESFGVGRREGLQRIDFVLTLAPGEHALAVRGVLHARGWSGGGLYVMPAVLARHPLLAQRPRPESYQLEYLLGPLKTWGGDPEVSVEVWTAPGWTVGGDDWSRGDRGQHTRKLKVKTAQDRLRLQLDSPEPAFVPGGVQLGVGGVFGAGFALRAGYQFALPEPLLHTVSLDTRFSTLELSYVVEAATPQIILLPSVGAGLGVIGRVWPDRRLGARALIDLHFFVLGLAFAWDWYPNAGSELSLMGQLSL